MSFFTQGKLTAHTLTSAHKEKMTTIGGSVGAKLLSPAVFAAQLCSAQSVRPGQDSGDISSDTRCDEWFLWIFCILLLNTGLLLFAIWSIHRRNSERNSNSPPVTETEGSDNVYSEQSRVRPLIFRYRARARMLHLVAGGCPHASEDLPEIPVCGNCMAQNLATLGSLQELQQLRRTRPIPAVRRRNSSVDTRRRSSRQNEPDETEETFTREEGGPPYLESVMQGPYPPGPRAVAACDSSVSSPDPSSASGAPTPSSVSDAYDTLRTLCAFHIHAVACSMLARFHIAYCAYSVVLIAVSTSDTRCLSLGQAFIVSVL